MTPKTTIKKTKTTKSSKEKSAISDVAKKAKKTETVNEPVNLQVEVQAELKAVKPVNGPEKYYESIGRRKESTARVRVFTKKSTDNQVAEERALILVNGKPYYEYFRTSQLQNIIEAPLKKLKSLNRFKATVKVSGGGIHGQADAIKFGLSRALVLFDLNFSKKLKKAGFLTRDAREKERRKYGLKKARKAPQWAKR